jgi:predicted ATPase
MEGAVHIPRAKDTAEKDDSTRGGGSDILSRAARHGRAVGVASRPAGYCMIESAELQNFRGFRKAELSGLRRINLVVGDNGAGKTALLEGLFLVASPSPEVALRVRAWRSFEIGIASPADLYNSIFHPLFRNRDLAKAISISTKGSAHSTRSVDIYYADNVPISVQLEPGPDSIQSSAYAPVTFVWTNERGEKKTVIPRIDGNRLDLGTGFPARYDSNFLAARAPLPTGQNAQWFSDMSKRAEEANFVREIKKQFPEIKSLNIEIEAGANALWASSTNGHVRMPLNLISEGMTKIVTIFLQIEYSKKTAVFIDEIENGIHFSRQEELWKQLYSFGTSNDTQVFASTHSLECLRAALPAMRKYPEGFSLIRVSHEKGESAANVISGKEAISVIQSGLEVRE